MSQVQAGSQVHIRYEGHSYDLTFTSLGDVGYLSSDEQIRSAIATHLNVPRTKLNAFDLSRNEETQSITLRPQASFGE